MGDVHYPHELFHSNSKYKNAVDFALKKLDKEAQSNPEPDELEKNRKDARRLLTVSKGKALFEKEIQALIDLGLLDLNVKIGKTENKMSSKSVPE